MMDEERLIGEEEEEEEEEAELSQVECSCSSTGIYKLQMLALTLSVRWSVHGVMLVKCTHFQDF
jgi:hypothetical protein